jgi:prepilin-type N-terminal cleavage/methylation domain-containing protein
MVTERGFTLIEFMIAMAITAAVLGGTVTLASQLQQVYSTQLDDTTVEEEVRFVLDWMTQALRNAGSNPYSITASLCGVGGAFAALTITGNDSVRIHSDMNPPNGLLGGDGLTCDEDGEDVTIAHDAAAMVITRQDHNVDFAPVVMTEPVIEDLVFTYLDSSRNVTANANLVSYVRVTVTGKSEAYNTLFGEGTTSVLETEVHIRTR